MKLSDITKNLSDMTDEELREHVKHIRHVKYIAKPAKQKHVDDAVKKTTRKKVSSAEKLIDGLSEEEKAQLILQLSGGE